MLTDIVEFDASGDEFNKHTLAYHDDVNLEGIFSPFKDPEKWTPQYDKVDANFLNPIDGFTGEASALSGTKSVDFGFGMAVTVGFNPNVASKASSVGGNFGFAQSTSEGLLCMIDINGDGLPDKVFTNGSGISYRPNLSGPSGQPVFGESVAIKGVKNFHKEKSQTISGGIEAHAPGGILFAGVGASKTTSTTTVYFTEVNGDQLPDVVVNGKVYFNRINPQTGYPEYNDSSGGTPSPINPEGTIKDGIFETDPAEKEEAINQSPLHDVVKMWVAPYNGKVSITAPVRLSPISESIREENPVDGVRVAIQLRGKSLWDATIASNDHAVHTPVSVTNLTVKKGDRIYFRVGSVENGSYDQVLWAPVIEYQNQNLNETDANRSPLYRFSSKQEFLLSSPQQISPPLDGQVRIQGTFTKPVTTDNVTLQILKKVSNTETVVWEKVYVWNEIVKDSITKDIAVQKETETYTETYSFKVKTSSNIDWSAVKWRPRMFYTVSTDPKYPVKGSDGKDLIELYPVPEYSIYADIIRISKLFKVDQEVSSVKIEPVVNVPTQTFLNGTIYFTIKKLDSLIHKDTLVVSKGSTTDSLKSVTIKSFEGDSLFFEYFVDNNILANSISSAEVKVTQNDKTTAVSAGIHSYLSETDDKHIIYGPLYRGWGQFAYNGNRGRATADILEGELKLSNDIKKKPDVDVNNIGEGTELEGKGTYDPAKENFIVLVANGKRRNWMGYDNQTYVTADTISSSRMGNDDLTQAQAISKEGAGARGINKISKSTGYSFSAGGGVGFVNGSYGKSYGTTKVLSDFMDMNGDRYPDIVTDKYIQYTNSLGGLSDQILQHERGENHITKTESDGVSLSGSFVTSKSQSSATNAKKPTISVGTGYNSVGLSGNFGKGTNNAEETWMDINGDGLPDRVKENGMVRLNLGYGFTDEEQWSFTDIQKGSSTSYGGGLGISLWNGSISAGVSMSRSDNFSKKALQDINGDGLVDIVTEGSPMKVRLNTGNGFSEEKDWKGAFQITKSSAANEGANIAFTFGIYIPTGNIKICFNPSINAGRGMTRDLEKLSDVDGDGYPDYVKSDKDDNLLVSRSNIGRTNLLKSVQRPLGASFGLDYERLGNTYQMPNDVWALTTVSMKDGFAGDGVDSMLTTFVYEGGYFDRHERDFYGFSKVVTNSHNTGVVKAPVYTTVTQNFKNDNYYEKGLLTTEVMQDVAGNKYIEKANFYQIKDIITGEELPDGFRKNDAGNAFVALTETEQKFFEGKSEAGKSTRSAYSYDRYGNATTFHDFGDSGDEDDISAAIAYHYLENIYVVSVPKSIIVTGSGKTLRKRDCEIDPSTGNVKKIKQYLEDGKFAVHELEYDEFGNLKKITRPANHKEERLSFEYEYDNMVHSYTTKVSNSYGYSSEGTYDFRFGQILTSKDLNGNQIGYEIDDLGRVVKIVGPYEKASGSGYTIQFEYHPEATVPYALTKHFDPANPKNDLETSIFVDGLGRVLQTKKDIALYQGDGAPDKEKMVVSGAVKFDAFGRTTAAYYPAMEDVGTPGTFNRMIDAVKPTTSTYDVMNRVLAVTLPDGAVTKTEYGFGNDRKGVQQFTTKTTDANNKITEQFTDVKGRVTSVKNHTSDKPVWTSFAYNAINEQVEATDDLGFTTHSTYDWFGRRTTRVHPDAGTTNYAYDLAGNLIQLTTANLLESGGAIQYAYDRERLVTITYPQNPENNVKYTYGKAGDTDNRAGRIVLQEDASGAQEFFYGPLGEVVKNIRTVVIPQHDEQTFTTEWKYDTWNRLTSMTYADGEVVEYSYNAGGLLQSMNGKKKGDKYNYVKQLGYDKFEQRVFLAYGNGTKTSYNYEPERRRLSNMVAKTNAGRIMMDNVYGYDKVNNILSLKNNAPIPSSNLMGGSSEYTYSYDDLYRLTTAAGTFKGSNESHKYSLEMSYNTVGGITEKNQLHERKGGSITSWTQQKKTTYDLEYTYGNDQPHAPTHIGEQTFTYDKNGNQTGWTHDVSGQRRKIIWDEENRMRSLYDNGAAFHYIYDAAGERVLKGRSKGQSIYVDAESKGGSGNMSNFTVYVNPYIVLKSGGYTKHYYIEGQRIVSKLGGGWDNTGKGPLKAGGDKVNYSDKKQKVQDGIVKNLKFLGMDGQILTAGKSGKIPPGQLNGGSTSTSESFQYYYHPDHLGSTSYMTDASGEVYQHLEYFAFGETFVEEHSNTDRTPYLYNGKELDEETGLYYYGARYYDARISVWLGVDPKFFKYPGFSPYNYCINNPINYIDPDGREIWITYYQGGSEQHIKYSPGDKYEGKNKFLIKSYEALNYLNSSKTGNKLLSDLDKIDDKLHIKQGSKTEYDHEDNIAYFNPSQGLKLDDKEGKKRQTPALGLLHELAHGLKNLLNPEEYSIETQDYKDPQLYEQWSSPEEKRVIENIENPAARELNDIYNNNESERKTHKIGKDQTMKTSSPTSTTSVQEEQK